MPRLAGGTAFDVLAVDQQVAASLILEPGDDAQQRGFAAARGADEDHELAVGDIEVDARAAPSSARSTCVTVSSVSEPIGVVLQRLTARLSACGRSGRRRGTMRERARRRRPCGGEVEVLADRA